MGSLPAAVSVTVATDLTLMVSVGTLTSVAGGLVSASNFVLDRLQTQLVNDLTKGGYHKCLPGQTTASVEFASVGSPHPKDT
jgi:hypothetical protein